MRSSTIISALVGFYSIASAHMLMSNPLSLRYKDNKNVPSDKVDYSLVNPLNAMGGEFPCKGYQSDLGTPAGVSVAEWPAASSQNITIEGGASHEGGSCQVSLSYDKAKTFTVIHSYIGNCPTSSGGSFPFTVPADAPSGAALFAWTWFNKVGNREMYMNCASVTITGSGIKKRTSTSFSSRPSIFVANVNNGCSTTESTDVMFPNPGPDVTDISQSHGNPVGNGCAAAFGPDGGSASGSVASVSAPSSAQSSSHVQFLPSTIAASTTVPAINPTSQGTSFATIPSYMSAGQSTNSTIAPSSAPTAQGGSSPSADGSCGGQVSCIGSIHGSCCSQYGFCGSTSAYCGAGCQSAFGICGNSNTTGPSLALQVSTDKSCGPTTSNTCQGSKYGNCCSQYGYCGNTSDYCGTGCQSGFGTCGLSSAASSPGASSPAAGSSSVAIFYSVATSSSANPTQYSPSTFLTTTSAQPSASAVSVIPVTDY